LSAEDDAVVIDADGAPGRRPIHEKTLELVTIFLISISDKSFRKKVFGKKFSEKSFRKKVFGKKFLEKSFRKKVFGRKILDI
jgi:hypothetical protein